MYDALGNASNEQRRRVATAVRADDHKIDVLAQEG